jgi:DUF1009 family protein
LQDGQTPLGIIAFGGRLPIAVAEAVAGQGRPVFIVAMRGMADPAIERWPHGWFRAYEVGRVLGLLRAHGCKDIVFVGVMLRPRLRDVRIDLRTLRELALLLVSHSAGDDSLLVRVTQGFEKEGFRVVAVADVAPSLVGPAGTLTKARPREEGPVWFGFEVLGSLGPHDIGQAAVVYRRRVIAVEAAEGTLAMVERVGVLRANGRFAASGKAGVLVKGPKPQQELRNDMPALGPETVAAAAAASLEGIAYIAGEVLLIDAAEMVRAADEAGLWLAGFERPRKQS